MGSGASAGKHWKTFGLNSLDQRVVLYKEEWQKSQAVQQPGIKQRRQGREEGHAEDDGPAKTGVNVKKCSPAKRVTAEDRLLCSTVPATRQGNLPSPPSCAPAATNAEVGF